MVIPLRHDLPAAVIRLYRQFSMPPIDQHGKLDLARASMGHNRVHRGSHRTARVNYLVDKNDPFAIHIERDLRFVGLFTTRAIVAERPDVDLAARDWIALYLRHLECEALCNRISTPNDA